MAKNKNEELATVAPETTALATADDFSEFAGDQDKLTKDDLIIERYRIVQAMTKGKREAGLKDGQIYATMSKKGYDKVLLVPIHDYRTIVERSDDNKGMFLGELSVDDPKVVAAVAANGGKYNKLVSAAGPDGKRTRLVDTRNVFCAFLDPEDGITPIGFGILQADSTNIRPYLQWRQDRVAFQGGVNYPTYAFRTFVDGLGEYTNPEGNVTQLYRFTPFKDGNWKTSCLSPKNPEELALLRQCRDQKDLMIGGKVNVAKYSDEEQSEEALEAQAFDADAPF